MVVGFDVLPLVTPLSAGDDAELVGLRFLAGSHDLARSDRVDCYRLFHEDVLVGLHGGLEHLRPEIRRRCQDHVIEPRDLEQLLIGVESDKAGLIGELGLRPPFEAASARVELILEEVGKGDDLQVLSGPQEILNGTRPPSSAADEPCFNHLSVRRFVQKLCRCNRFLCAAPGQEHSGSRHGSGAHEIAARKIQFTHIRPPSL